MPSPSTELLSRDGVDAVAQVEHIRVVPVAAGQMVITRAGNDGVVAGARVDGIRARAAVDNIVALISDHRVVAALRVDHVLVVAPQDVVVTLGSRVHKAVQLNYGAVRELDGLHHVGAALAVFGRAVVLIVEQPDRVALIAVFDDQRGAVQVRPDALQGDALIEEDHVAVFGHAPVMDGVNAVAEVEDVEVSAFAADEFIALGAAG